ncbi:type III-A CRISPR-associated RAMP protein Csm5 [Planktothrix mougeotii]|uniref:CRISPR system Cms protein Csm5 n=1 Tax=Planktothrix mougeotii LEGE 06226 TaxID=1828728 RepID=A0ABR9U677_9CYAN|nr:type III-A CRISPR-associated RAMP protein Csm5 [Planktothrix mougeotii]MBE9141968.1 type III-A CRISPR-associated RAMP protein Csm5 [Planktothrix mougeotii LEGE 06226]
MVSTPENALVKPEVYETKRIQLKSPILHIGSEVSKLSPFEYVQTSNQVYLPNSDLLAKALYQREKLQEYIRRIENREEITSLLKEAFGENWQNNEQLEAIFPKTGISRKWTEEKISDLRPMIRNGFGQRYIPGSSIKGAIRTAIAYYLLKHSERYQVPQNKRVSAIELKLRETMGEVRRNSKFADDHILMNELFSNYSLSYQEKAIRCNSQKPNTDFMRAVSVTDTQPLLEEKTLNKKGQTVVYNFPVATEVIVSSYFEGGKAKYKSPIYTEMVRTVKTEFTLSIDFEMLSWFQHCQGMQIPFKNIDGILKICQEFAQEQWDYEHDYWEEIKDNQNAKDNNRQPINLDYSKIRELYELEKCPFSLRVGWGTGMIGTTVNLCFDDELRAEIRDNCSPNKAPGFEAPKSRRVVAGVDREIKFAPGWVKFKVL